MFIAVVEEGTIAAAAAREHVVAAAVSKRITKLENTLQTQLVSRTNKGLEPTAAGNALVNLARRVLLDLDEIYAQMHEYSMGIRGHVRVAANVSAITQFLPGEIKTFLSEHPQVQIHLEEKSSTAIAKAIAENAAHVGVFTMGIPHEQDLQTFPYHNHRLVVITSSEHPLAERPSVSFEETLAFEYVGLHSGSAINFQLIKAAAELNKRLMLRIHVTSYDALCLMVEAGLGIGILPDTAARPYVNSHRIRALSLDELWADRELRICVRSFDALPMAARLLVNHLKRIS
ncbi:MAG TPA: LysR family transcriptional regulator [Burkholderiales bacterium]|nr:LysR family transcriptional regulator [Burkholderiales bacterium]